MGIAAFLKLLQWAARPTICSPLTCLIQHTALYDAELRGEGPQVLERIADYETHHVDEAATRNTEPAACWIADLVRQGRLCLPSGSGRISVARRDGE